MWYDNGKPSTINQSIKTFTYTQCSVCVKNIKLNNYNIIIITVKLLKIKLRLKHEYPMDYPSLSHPFPHSSALSFHHSFHILLPSTFTSVSLIVPCLPLCSVTTCPHPLLRTPSNSPHLFSPSSLLLCSASQINRSWKMHKISVLICYEACLFKLLHWSPSVSQSFQCFLKTQTY